MVAITSPSSSKVLVTGANGFLAVWVVKSLLDKGYTVVGTVRSTEKGVHLQNVFQSYGDKFQLAIVKDITAEGAFDDLVKDVDVIEHTASPFHFNGKDPQEFIVPALNGTLGVLKSALKYGKNVKRVVITSSTAAIHEPRSEPTIFSEKDWNNADVQAVKTGSNPSSSAMYMASKSIAERAAWDFVKENQSEISWDLVVLNPPYIFGPNLHEVSKPSELNASSAMFFNTVVAGSTNNTPQELAAPRGGFIDVRDIALAHALALEKERAGGERIIISSGTWCFQDFLDAANSLSPQPLKGHDIPRGVPGAGNNITHRVTFQTTKMKEVLGLEPRNKEQITRDSFEDYAAKGW